VVYGGTPDYSLDPRSTLPAGLYLSPSGFLQGTPATAGPQLFVLIVNDSATPVHTQEGTYVLNVMASRPAPKAPARAGP
jgi:hypothetical protein